MAEAAEVRRPVTVEAFLAFEGEGDARYELVDGEILAMAAPSEAHGVIVVNAAVLASRALDGRSPCRAVAEAGIRLDEHNHFRADLAVTCGEPRGAASVEEPLLIVEVLSESTADRDLGRKLQRYIALPSLREVWLIDSTTRWVQVWRRAGEAWIVTLPLAGSARFASEVLGGAEIALDALYRHSGL